MAETAVERKGKINPLLIDLVVENIAEYLNLQDLKACRGINRLWMKATRKQFLKFCPPLYLTSVNERSSRISEDGEAFINFIDEETTFKSGKYHKLHQMSISQYMEVYSDHNHAEPYAQLLRMYRKFHVHNLEDENDIPEFYNFLTKVGPQVTYLELVNLKVVEEAKDRKDILSCKNTPNAKALVVKNLWNSAGYGTMHPLRLMNTGSGGEPKENKHLTRLSLTQDFMKSLYAGCKVASVCWLNVLLGYPNLKALSVTNYLTKEFEDIVSALATIRKQDPKIMALTELKCKGIRPILLTSDEEEDVCWLKIVELLESANLPLEKLALNGLTTKKLFTSIPSYTSTLKHLTWVWPMGQKIPLPKMEFLEKVVLAHSDKLELLSEAPNLKSLSLKLIGGIHHSFAFTLKVPTPIVSLTTFKCDDSKEWDNLDEMEQLIKWMPNIQVLRMRLFHNTFSWVCQHWPNLKELTVLGRKVNDESVVGSVKWDLVDEDIRPNITKLRELETFRMIDIVSENVWRFDYRLTEKSVFEGFAHMPKLSKLEFTVKSELSKVAMDVLTSRIINLKIHVLKPCVRMRKDQ